MLSVLLSEACPDGTCQWPGAVKVLVVRSRARRSDLRLMPRHPKMSSGLRTHQRFEPAAAAASGTTPGPAALADAPPAKTAAEGVRRKDAYALMRAAAAPDTGEPPDGLPPPPLPGLGGLAVGDRGAPSSTLTRRMLC